MAGNAGQHRSPGVGDGRQRVGAEHRRGAGQHEDPALPAGDVASVAEVLVALQLREQAGRIVAEEDSADGIEVRGAASSSAVACSRKSSTMTVSASITSTVSNGPNVGSS